MSFICGDSGERTSLKQKKKHQTKLEHYYTYNIQTNRHGCIIDINIDKLDNTALKRITDNQNFNPLR